MSSSTLLLLIIGEFELYVSAVPVEERMYQLKSLYLYLIGKTSRQLVKH
jgi:hypothetical protein